MFIKRLIKSLIFIPWLLSAMPIVQQVQAPLVVRCACNDIRNSVNIIEQTFSGDINARFYHLQSQYGEASHHPCACGRREIIRTYLRSRLDTLRPQISSEMLEEIRTTGEMFYEGN